MKYLIDADVFIRAKDTHYGMDFCPGFWDWLVTANVGHKVFSVMPVLIELQRVEDELSEWASRLPTRFFLPSDAVVRMQTQSVHDWVEAQQRYQNDAKRLFFEGADSILIGHAKAYGYTVVTHETSSPYSRKSVKIPDVCRALDVQYMSPFEMLRQERARFVLDSTAPLANAG